MQLFGELKLRIFNLDFLNIGPCKIMEVVRVTNAMVSKRLFFGLEATGGLEKKNKTTLLF